MSSIGSRLKKIRDATGLSQTSFGQAFGVSKATQVNYETDKRSPDTNYLTALHAAGHDITYIVTGELQSDALSPAETSLVHMFRRVDPERQEVVLSTLRLMAPPMSQIGKEAPSSGSLHDDSPDYHAEQ